MKLSSIVAVALLAMACNQTSSRDTSDDEGSKPAKTAEHARSATATAAPSAPARPTFKATMMGMAQAQPIVEVALAPDLPGYVIQAPEQTKVEKGFGGMGVELSATSVNYSMSIREWAFDAAKAKADFKTVDAEGTLLVDTPDLVVFQRKHGGVLFAMGITLGDKKLECHSVVTAFEFDRATIDQTIETCRSLKRVGGAETTAASATPPGASAPPAEAPPPAGPPGKPVTNTPPKSKPVPCNCPKGDLMCNMRCNGH
jgi:hypothetical protein